MIHADERLDTVNENLQLIQKKNGLTFGTDAYLLYAYMKGKRKGYAVDLGSGTGIISLLCLAKGKFEGITAVEIQEEFADIIVRNARLNRLEEKLTVLCADVRAVSAISLSREFDTVFSNPPYMTADSGRMNESESKRIARHEVFGDIRDFCHSAASLLKYGGSFYVVYRPDRLSDLFKAMAGAGLEPKRMTSVHADCDHAPSLVLVEARKGGAPGLYFTKPLFMKDSDGNASQEIEYIYQNGEFQDEYTRP